MTSPLPVKDPLTDSRRGISVGWKAAALACLAVLTAATAPAEDKDKVVTTANSSNSAKLSLESEFHSGYVGYSTFRERSERGRSDAWDIGTRQVLSIQANEAVLLRFGFELQRYNFSVPDTLVLPTKLQSASIVIGADFQLGDAWIARVEVQPGYYGASTDLRAGNFAAPIVVGASYFYSSDLQFVAGLSIDVNRKYPVLPGIGFRYKCNADWVLDLILPQPRIEYSLNSSTTLYAGGDLQGATYRTDTDFGDRHGNPKLNNAWIDYSQIRVGVGASVKIRPEVTLEVEAGIVPVQEFDFHRADVRASSTEIPPYGGIVLKAAF
jgi:hypothetical protein